MKTTALRTWTAIGLTVLITGAGFRALADQPATADSSDKTYTGTVTAVDPKERVLTVKGLLWSKQFNLGQDCKYVLLDKGLAAPGDLRAGQRVRVSYEKAHGVLVANRVTQHPMRYEGTVKTIDPQKRIMTVHQRALDKDFQLAEGCRVMLRNSRFGTLDDIQVGHRVTVLYEVPDKVATARQIAQTSATFEGAVTAIDTNERTLKAKSVFGTKKFNLADDCKIMLSGKTDGQIRDLKPGDRLMFSYDDVNGVNIVTRITVPEPAPENITVQTFDGY